MIAEFDVMRAAPAELNAAGYADLMAKTVAGADWLLADAAGTDPINPGAWDIIQGRLREVLANPAGVRTGDLDTLNRLVQGLMLGGLAMVRARSSPSPPGPNTSSAIYGTCSTTRTTARYRGTDSRWA